MSAVQKMIARFGETILVRRFDDNGEYIHGQYYDDGSVEFTIQASVQPLTGTEKLDEPTLRRVENTVRIYTTERLRTTDTKANRRADIITWDGDEYEIKRTENWGKAGVPHYKSMAERMGDD